MGSIRLIAIAAPRKKTPAVRPIRVGPGVLEFEATSDVDAALAGSIGKLLIEWTGRPWSVTLGDQTLRLDESLLADRPSLAAHVNERLVVGFRRKR